MTIENGLFKDVFPIEDVDIPLPLPCLDYWSVNISPEKGPFQKEGTLPTIFLQGRTYRVHENKKYSHLCRGVMKLLLSCWKISVVVVQFDYYVNVVLPKKRSSTNLRAFFLVLESVFFFGGGIKNFEPRIFDKNMLLKFCPKGNSKDTTWHKGTWMSRDGSLGSMVIGSMGCFTYL